MVHTSLVTGASKGIGAALTTAMRARSAQVIAHYNTGDAPTGDGIESVQADLAEKGQAELVWRFAVRDGRRVHSLVCNAGIMPRVAPDLPLEEWAVAWQQVFQVNVLQTAEFLRLAAPAMAAWGGGSIAVLSSTVSHRGSQSVELAPYAASKAAVAGLAKTYARAYAQDNVCVHVIAPGAVRTGMPSAYLRSTGLDTASLRAAEAAMADPDEVAAVIADLIVDRRPALSGATIDMGGADYIR